MSSLKTNEVLSKLVFDSGVHRTDYDPSGDTNSAHPRRNVFHRIDRKCWFIIVEIICGENYLRLRDRFRV